jgi:nucleotide-binding universal stress UspA family protein
MFRRILVLLDPGLVGRRIVPWVRRLLAPVGGDVHLLAVLAPAHTVIAGSRTLSYASQSEDAARGAASVVLAGVAARLRDDGFAVSSEVRFGDPGAEALATAQAWGAEAIALVDVPARGARRWLTRNVADDIIQKSPVPVLVGRASGQRSA